MRKPAFCIFLWPLYSDMIFFIDHCCVGLGVSYKHYLLPFLISNIFSETAWPINAKFHVDPPWEGEKVYINSQVT